MIFGGYLTKGILLIIAGLLTLVLAFVYVYFYLNNKTINARDKKVFGPTSILVTNLAINIILFILSISMVFIYYKSLKGDLIIQEKIEAFCPKKIINEILNISEPFNVKQLDSIILN